MLVYLIISRAGVDGVEQEINDWASELDFIQVSLDILIILYFEIYIYSL